MAYVAGEALVQRLDEVLIDSRGVLRTVPSGRFLGDFPEGLTDDEQLRRALVKPRVRAELRMLGRSKNSPPVTGNLVIYDIEVDVTILRAVQRKEQLAQSLKTLLTGAAIADMDVVRQALEYPDNLLQTQAAVATDLISGLLAFVRADQGVAREVNDGAQKLESTLTFRGWLISRPAVT